MGLQLKAEEKSILALFTGDKNQYIIPPYQRPYSWDEEQCRELFEDLIKAFEDEKTDSYFLGNIVIASSKENQNRLEVIDGQQRLATLTLLLKALYFFDDENKKLKSSIWKLDDRTDDAKEQRLETMVFQDKDSKFLKDALKFDLGSNDCTESKKDNQFIKNICYFFYKLEDFEIKKLYKFTDFLLYDVSILPIQTQGDNKDIARENALKIFETINNRGISLSTADILKARLFSNALSFEESDDFIKQWNLLYSKCEEINYSIDNIFEIYKNIVEIEEELEYQDIGIREFFKNIGSNRFFDKKYDEVMKNLFKIIDCILFNKYTIIDQNKYGELTKWSQVFSEIFSQRKFNFLKDKYSVFILYKYDYKNSKNYQKIISEYQNIIKYALTYDSPESLFDNIDKRIKNKEKFYAMNKSINDDTYSKHAKYIQLLNFYLTPSQNAIYPYDNKDLELDTYNSKVNRNPPKEARKRINAFIRGENAN